LLKPEAGDQFAFATYKGCPLLGTPRTEPDVRHSRIRLPPWMFNGEVSVHGPVQGTRLPGSESGACWLVPCSPWPPPFAPPTPAPVARRRSPASQLLWRGLTSHARASPASAHHLPDADQGATALARREISRFPGKERTHMLGSTTAPGRPGARDDAPVHVAFRSMHSVGVPGVLFSRLNTQPMR